MNAAPDREHQAFDVYMVAALPAVQLATLTGQMPCQILLDRLPTHDFHLIRYRDLHRHLTCLTNNGYISRTAACRMPWISQAQANYRQQLEVWMLFLAERNYASSSHWDFFWKPR